MSGWVVRYGGARLVFWLLFSERSVQSPPDSEVKICKCAPSDFQSNFLLIKKENISLHSLFLISRANSVFFLLQNKDSSTELSFFVYDLARSRGVELYSERCRMSGCHDGLYLIR